MLLISSLSSVWQHSTAHFASFSTPQTSYSSPSILLSPYCLSLSPHALLSLYPHSPQTTPCPLGLQPQFHPEAVISGQTFIPVYARPALHHQPIEKPQLPQSAVHTMQGRARRTRVLIGIPCVDYSCMFALAWAHHSKHIIPP